jgi:hypothetical protein
VERKERGRKKVLGLGWLGPGKKRGERAHGEGKKGRDAGLGWPAAGLSFLCFFFSFPLLNLFKQTI